MIDYDFILEMLSHFKSYIDKSKSFSEIRDTYFK